MANYWQGQDVDLKCATLLVQSSLLYYVWLSPQLHSPEVVTHHQLELWFLVSFCLQFVSMYLVDDF